MQNQVLVENAGALQTAAVNRTLLLVALLLVALMGAIDGITWLSTLPVGPWGAFVLAAAPTVLWLSCDNLGRRPATRRLATPWKQPSPKSPCCPDAVSTRALSRVALLGCFVAGPAAAFLSDRLLAPLPLLTNDFDPFHPGHLARTLWAVPLTQEFCKFLAGGQKYAEGRDPGSELAAMVAAGMGFAAWQGYRDLQALAADALVGPSAARVAVATLTHIGCAALLGNALVRSRYARTALRRTAMVLAGFAAATLVNGHIALALVAVPGLGMVLWPWPAVAGALAVTAAAVGAAALCGQPGPAPAAQPRRDRSMLAVVLALGAVLALAQQTHRLLTAPRMRAFAHLGLHLQRPEALGAPLPAAVEPPLWYRLLPTPPVPPSPGAEVAAVPTAAVPTGQTVAGASTPDHVVLTAPANPWLRIEVRVASRPPQVKVALNLQRSLHYGALYHAFATRPTDIAGRSWWRTEFQYADQIDTEPTRQLEPGPSVVTGIEYATATDSHLYIVTMHGRIDEAQRLAALVAPTLHVAPSRPGREAPRP